MVLRTLPPPEYAATSEEVARRLENAKLVALDTETTGLDILRDEIVVWSFSTGEDRVCAPRAALHGLLPFLRRPDSVVIFHRANYDLHLLANAGIHVYDYLTPERVFDTVVMDCVLAPNSRHRLKILTKDRLGLQYDEFKSHDFEELKTGVINGRPSDDLIDYASKDAIATFLLYQLLCKELEEIPRTSRIKEILGQPAPTLLDYYKMLDQAMQMPLYRMTRRGVAIDVPYLESVIPVLLDRQHQILHQIINLVCETTGERRMINLNSIPQLDHLLYDVLKYEVPRVQHKGKSHLRPTGEEALLIMETLRPGVPGLLLKYREHTPASVKGLLQRLRTGRLHTTFNLNVTATGRLSSTDPNLQNVKKSGDPSIRRAFVPSSNFKFIVADWSQVELRILGELSRVQTICGPLLAGDDLHVRTGANLPFKMSYEDIMHYRKLKTDDPEAMKLVIRASLARKVGKTINFGTVYGLSPFGLRKNLAEDGVHISQEEAKSFLDHFWRSHKDLETWFGKLVQATAKHGYVQTLLGRRRPISDLEGEYPNRESLNQTYNTPVQGSAAELVKWKMVELSRGADAEYLRKTGTHMLLQVHDELIFETPKEHADEVCAYLKQRLEEPPFPMVIPLLADVNVADNWEEGHG